MTNGDDFDPRLTPARPDLAAAALRGRVTAARFVEGRRHQVTSEVADVKRLPRADAAVDTQLLHGDVVEVFDEAEGWCWVQAVGDGYVGYVAADALTDVLRQPTHRVAVNRTFVYPAPDMKRPVAAALPREARVTVKNYAGAFATLADGGFVIADHLGRLDQHAADFVAVAETYLGAPYLWGGRTVGGIDCSGLVQIATAAAGIIMPRDTDMQQCVAHASSVADASVLRRGDLVFWRGHVGIMADAATLLHANGHHMLVMREALSAAQARIKNMTGTMISAMRRLDRLTPA